MDAAAALVTPGPADSICWWKGKPTEASHFCAYSGQFAVESRQTELAIWTNPHPSSAVRGQSQCPPPPPLPIPNGSRGASVADLRDRSLFEDRQTDGRLLLSFIAFPEDFRGTVVSAEAFWMLPHPPKPPHHTSSALEMKRCSVPCF